MIGSTLRHIRTEKGFSLRDISSSNLSHTQLYRIENDTQVPSVEKFFTILYKLNISFDEFCDYSDSNYISIRTKVNIEIGEILRKKNIKKIKEMTIKMEKYYQEYGDIYFHHMKCILNASEVLITSNNNYTLARNEVNDISKYLISIDNWFFYELYLLNNTLFYYGIKEAITLGEKALKTIEEKYTKYNDNEITRRILTNLAVYCLQNSDYYFFAYKYSNAAIGLPQSTQHIYSTIFAKIINQIACYKLENGEFDLDYLSNLINSFELFKMYDIYKEFKEFVRGHGIIIK